MTMALPEEQVVRVRSMMQAGHFTDEASVVVAALDLLERKQRLLAMVQEGIDAADRGEVLDHESVFGEVRKRIAETVTRHSQEAMAE